MNFNSLLQAKHRPLTRYLTIAAVCLSGIVALSACQTAQQRVIEHEDSLAAAGFIVRPANTDARKAMLARLPPNHFVRREKGDDVHYVYADPLVCGCLYVGSQQAYNEYKRHQQEQNLANERQMTAESYQDASWNWGAWGPWDGGYGFGYGGAVGW